MKKKIIVLDHGGGRMANQLWNDMALYAYTLEHGYDFENWAGFEYACYFGNKPKNFFVRYIFFNTFIIKTKNFFIRKYIIRKFLKKIIYKIFTTIYSFFIAKNIGIADKDLTQKLKAFEKSNEKIFYTKGWLYRNPIGLEKFRTEINKFIFPNKNLFYKQISLLDSLRAQNFTIVGVHFRQGDFRTVPAHHIWFFNEKEIRKILDEYLVMAVKNVHKTVFVFCSDEPFNTTQFTGLTIISGSENELSDLFLLSHTDTIIGSKSTYGELAAFLGNIPFIVFERNGVEWDYYKNKKRYFENKKSMLNSIS